MEIYVLTVYIIECFHEINLLYKVSDIVTVTDVKAGIITIRSKI
jgi:hypothetical protein